MLVWQLSKYYTQLFISYQTGPMIVYLCAYVQYTWPISVGIYTDYCKQDENRMRAATLRHNVPLFPEFEQKTEVLVNRR